MTAKTDFNVLACGIASELPQNRLKDRKTPLNVFVRKKSPAILQSPIIVAFLDTQNFEALSSSFM
jgi:hypothetical protein